MQPGESNIASRLPDWLYASRDLHGERIRRVGSRQYGLVATYLSGDAYTSAALLATVWRFHFGLGPYGGVEAGFLDAGIRGRVWLLSGGRGLGLGWMPR
jgi:hypothetical protein